ncbi:unnamed protein product [Gongylonema pulchrum]|uniref:Uncharacterized protein n=1 Tax=Gongylonema pulchrum TaxID=637853 RepID=A0A3P6S8W1_9BILA|nr:unnamed protein product [Gongylonema pulchrum]
MGNATEESVFTWQVNSSDLDSLMQNGKCGDGSANTTSFLVRLHCWTEQASGVLFFQRDRRDKGNLHSSKHFKNEPQLMFRTSLSLSDGETRTFGAAVPNVNRGLQILLNVT